MADENYQTRQSAMDPITLRGLRETMKLTQGRFAEKLGVSRATVNRWEAGITVINAIHAAAIREALRAHEEAPPAA